MCHFARAGRHPVDAVEPVDASLGLQRIRVCEEV
jgi:hypothetical protein